MSRTLNGTDHKYGSSVATRRRFHRLWNGDHHDHGHASASADILESHRPLDPARDLDEAGDGLVADRTSAPTRKLCASVYVDRELREDVHRFFTRRDFQAWAPCHSVDLVAVLRHTMRADRLDAIRDWLLVMVGLLLTAALGRLSYPHWLIGCLVAASLVVGLSVLHLTVVRSGASWHKMASWIFNRRIPVAVVFVMLIAVLVHPLGRSALLALVLALAAAWLVIAVVGMIASVQASRLWRGRAPLRDQARPLPEQVEQRAESASRGNLLVYSGDRATTGLGPFIGAGHRLTRWSTSMIDVSKLKKEAVGARQFDVHALFQQLMSVLERQQVPGLNCQYRVFADGRSLGRSPELLENAPFGPPRAVVPEEVILDRLANPTNYQRGYLCIQATDQSWSGDVVTTMLVRVVREGNLVHLDLSVYALPPVELPGIPKRLTSAAWSGVKRSTAGCLATLLSVGPRRLPRLVSPLIDAVMSRLHRHQIKRGVGFDFGADLSLREHLALGQVMHYNVLVDTESYMFRLQHRLMPVFVDYLKSCGLDTREFVRETSVIITNVRQTFVEKVTANAVTFGDNSSATSSTAAPHPPASEGPDPT